MLSLERSVALTPGFQDHSAQMGLEMQPEIYRPLKVSSFSRTDEVVASLSSFRDFYSGPILTQEAGEFIGNRKSLRSGEFVLSRPYVNDPDYLTEGFSYPVDPFSSFFSLGGEGWFHMDGRVGIGIGYKSDAYFKPLSLGFVSFLAAPELTAYHQTSHEGEAAFLFSDEDMRQYSEQDVIFFQIQGQSLARIGDSSRREETRRVSESIAWRQLLVTLLAEKWAKDVGASRICIIPTEKSKWESVQRHAIDSAPTRELREKAESRYASYDRQYNGLAQKLGYERNEQGLWERPLSG
jgi:hypothetical protein